MLIGLIPFDEFIIVSVILHNKHGWDLSSNVIIELSKSEISYQLYRLYELLNTRSFHGFSPKVFDECLLWLSYSFEILDDTFDKVLSIIDVKKSLESFWLLSHDFEKEQ